MQEKRQEITTLSQAVKNAQLNLKNKFHFLENAGLFVTPENQIAEKADNTLNFLNPDSCFSSEEANKALAKKGSPYTDATKHPYTLNAIHATWNVLKQLEWVLNASLFKPINPLNVGSSLTNNLDYLLSDNTMPVINEDTFFIAQELLSFCENANKVLEEEYSNMIMKPLLDKAGFKISSTKELISKIITNLSDQIAQYEAIQNKGVVSEKMTEYSLFSETIFAAINKALPVTDARNFLDKIKPNELSLETVNLSIQKAEAYQTQLSESVIARELQNINTEINNIKFDTYLYTYGSASVENAWLNGHINKDLVLIKSEPLKELKGDVAKRVQMSQKNIQELREQLNKATTVLTEQKQLLLSDVFKTAIDEYIKLNPLIEPIVSIPESKEESSLLGQIKILSDKINTIYPEQREMYQNRIKRTASLLDTLSKLEQFINGKHKDNPIALPNDLDSTKALAIVSDRKKMLEREKEQEQGHLKSFDEAVAKEKRQLNRLISKNAENNLPALEEILTQKKEIEKEANSTYHTKQMSVFKQEVAIEQFKKESKESFKLHQAEKKTKSATISGEIEKKKEALEAIENTLEMLEQDVKEFENLAKPQIQLDTLRTFKNSNEKAFPSLFLLEVASALGLDADEWEAALSNLNKKAVPSEGYIKQFGRYVSSFAYDVYTPEEKLQAMIDDKIIQLTQTTRKNMQSSIALQYGSKTPTETIEFIDGKQIKLIQERDALIQSEEELSQQLITLDEIENKTKTVLQEQLVSMEENLSNAQLEYKKASEDLAESVDEVSKIKIDIARCKNKTDRSKLEDKQQAFLNEVDEKTASFAPALQELASQFDAIQQKIALEDPIKFADAKEALRGVKAQFATVTTKMSALREDYLNLKARVKVSSKTLHLHVASLSDLSKLIKTHEESVKLLQKQMDTKEVSVEQKGKEQLQEEMLKLLNGVKALSIEDFVQTHDKLLKIDNDFEKYPNLRDDEKYKRVLAQGFSLNTNDVIEATRNIFNLIQIIDPLVTAEAFHEIFTSSLPNDNALLGPQISARLDVLFQLIDAMDHKDESINALGVKLAHVANTLTHKRIALEEIKYPTLDVNDVAHEEYDLNEKTVRSIVFDVQLLENNVSSLINACDTFQLHLKNKIEKDYKSNPVNYEAYLSNNVLDFDKIVAADEIASKIAEEAMLDINKYKVMKSMHATLTTEDKPSEKLAQFKTLYGEKKELLESNADSAGLIFLKVVATILSLFIASPWLWAKESKPFTQNVDTFFALKKGLKAEKEILQEDANLPLGPDNH